jgi:L-serine dehydratase
MYTTTAELLQEAQQKQVALSDIILESEMALSGLSKEAVLDRLRQTFGVMSLAASHALSQPLPTVGSLIEGVAQTQFQYSQSGKTLCGPLLNRMMARAFSCSETNAAMGRICAAPTAGASGIIPAVILTVAEQLGGNEEMELRGLLVSSGIGAVITRNATVSGAEGGCQAECGVAAAMAAAAAVEMSGGSAEQALHAASFALINIMGLICDPIAGLVQMPCAQRNASQAMNAMLSADFALAGQKCPIPLDEVIDAMYKTGKMLPMQLRETALGGIAATPTGKRLAAQIFKV